jgi:hypothetical protein
VTTFPRETVSAVVQNATQVAIFRGRIEERYIDRATISNGPANSICVVYVGSIADINRVDGSGSGAGDTAEYPNGLYVPAGSAVYFVWNSNVQTSGAASATVQWRDA